MMHTYEAYGLRISSAIPLPRRTRTEGSVDAVILYGHLGPPPVASGTTAAGVRVMMTRKGALMFWDRTGTFLVRDGREITVDPAQEAAERTIGAAILGPVLAVLLHQRGRFTLHASSVAVDGAAVAFIGAPGQGKSTLALALVSRGHQLVADDITSVEFDRDVPMVFAGAPQLNVWPDALAALSYDDTALKRVDPAYDKRSFPVEEQFAGARLPLRCNYVIADGETPGIEPLAPKHALVELIRHTYTGQLLGTDAASHLQQCARLINSVAMRRLTVPHCLDEVPNVARVVERDCRSLTATVRS
jgi:hypothetical protein